MIEVRKTFGNEDELEIQKVLRSESQKIGFVMLVTIKEHLTSGCSAIALDQKKIVGATVAYKRKRDGVIKSIATVILPEYRGQGIWKKLKDLQLQQGFVEWKTTVENPSNLVFSRFCRLLKVEHGDKRKLNLWRLCSWNDPKTYQKMFGDYILNDKEKEK